MDKVLHTIVIWEANIQKEALLVFGPYDDLDAAYEEAAAWNARYGNSKATAVVLPLFEREQLSDTDPAEWRRRP